MLSEPRTISLIAEFLHVPVVHSAEQLREVYHEVCRTCGYEDFNRIQGGARIATQSQDREGFSHLNLLGDRIQMTDDHTGISVEQFAKKAVAVLRVVLEKLGVQAFLVQQNKVRVITTPNSFPSATEYLARSVFRVEPDQLQLIGRPTSVFGFRLVFPGTKEHTENFNARVESYVRDPRALYIENVGTFKQPLQASTLNQVEKNLRHTSDFISNQLHQFLSSYDRRETP